MKIKYRLSIFVIATMVLVVAGISFILVRQASDISFDLSVQSIKYLANEQAQYWKGREDGYIRMLRTLANIMADYEDLPPETRRDRYDDMLMGTITSEPNLVSIFTIWKPGSIDGMDARYIGRPGSTETGQYALTLDREGAAIIARAAADLRASMDKITGAAGRKERLENPEARTISGKNIRILKFEVPIISSATNEVVGCVGCLLDTGAIQNALQSVMRRYDEITAMAIYSGNGSVLGHFYPERVGRLLPDVDVEYGPERHAAFEAILGGKDFNARVYDPALGVNVRLVLTSFQIGDSDQHWAVMVGTSENIVLEPVQNMTRFALIIAAISALAVAALLFIVLSNMTKPIVRVTENLKDIAEGEGDLTRTIDIKSKDEIGALAHYFNETLKKIKNLVASIKKLSLSLSDIGGDLSANMSETAAAINQITANIQSIKARILNQSASVTETNATMEQITLNIDRLNEQVDVQTGCVAESSSSIEEMLANIESVTQTLIKSTANVRELSEASGVGRTGLENMSRDIQEIARESEGLLEINAVMENIASQTNLLSMNAAIEAAHAGEAGKGFAVVADEIRKLAEDSGGQSKTISTVLKKIKGAIDKIIQSADNVLKKFEAIDADIRLVAEQEENIRDAMEEQGRGSTQILGAIEKVNEVTRKVKGGSSEMLEGSGEVIRESKNLEKTTQEISGGMNEMAAGADQINAAVSKVNELSGKNREYIDLLVKEVSRFKVE